jgi:hypothetical protein
MMVSQYNRFVKRWTIFAVSSASRDNFTSSAANGANTKPGLLSPGAKLLTAPSFISSRISSIGRFGSVLNMSTSAERRSKDVRVVAVVVAELELRYIERHIFGTHLVKGADHAALEDRPETFDEGQAKFVLLGNRSSAPGSPLVRVASPGPSCNGDGSGRSTGRQARAT